MYYRNTVFQKGKQSISSMCVLFFSFFLLLCVVYLFPGISCLEKCQLLTTSFFYSYHLDPFWKFYLGTSLPFYCHKKQMLNFVFGILVEVRSGEYKLYTVITGLYSLLGYVQLMLYPHPANIKPYLKLLVLLGTIGTKLV